MGNVYSREIDVQFAGASGAIAFQRFYNSADADGAEHVPGWRHSYDQSIAVVNAPPVTLYPTTGVASPEYSTQQDACNLGFAAIKPNVSAWANVTASFSNGACVLSGGSGFVGTLPILGNATGATSSTAIEYDAIREDGQIVRFALLGGVLTSSQGTSLRLAITASGFTLKDDQDNVETYNASGVLLSIASRTGVVQSLSYDSSGQLQTVTDSFGNSLTIARQYAGLINSITLNGGGTVKYGYSASGTLSNVTNLDGTTRRYV
jgi:YD repeat-containing protein